MIIDPQLQAIWLNKTADKEAFSKAFEHAKKRGIFKGLDELHEKWRQLSELGSHATIGSISDRFYVATAENGKQTWQLSYSGVRDQRVWATSLFSMLLICFGMELIFFKGYEQRLSLDHVLTKMRLDFQLHKERTRESLKARYKVEPPVTSSDLVVL